MKIILSCLIALSLVACSAKEGARSASQEPEYKAAPPAASGSAQQGEARRYIAYKHSIMLQTPAASLQQQFRAIQAECLKLGCEIVSASHVAQRPNQMPRASLIARVPPKDFDSFFSTTLTHGDLLQHTSESDDKTAEVIDVEARIKNLEALRKRVLDLLEKRAGNLKEMLEAEKQLAETQSQLDSINGQRRALARQTDMVRVEIELQSESFRVEGSWIAPVADAAKESGHTLMLSIGALMMFVVTVAPWALVFFVVFFPLRRAWRKRKLKAATEK